jgi:NTE family protein
VNRPRVGIALGSGSARGWAHIGILRGLAERGIVPDVITGASVGALVGAACAAGRLDDLERWVRALTQRDVWRLVDTTFRAGGVMTGNRLMQAIEASIGNAPIESLPLAFAAVATDLYTGEEIWLRDGPYMTAVRASSGLPGLFAPTWHEGRWLIDGGVVNPVPVSLCRALGAEFVVAVDLSRSVTRIALRAQREAQAAMEPPPTAEVSAEGNAILKRWSGLLDGVVESFRSRRTEPGLFEVMASSVNIMQDRITRSRLATEPPDVVLRPDLAAFQLMDFHRADEAIEIGRRYVEQATEAFAKLQRSVPPAEASS